VPLRCTAGYLIQIMSGPILSPGLLAELDALRKEKDLLEKEVNDFRGMVNRIQSTRAKISDGAPNISESVTGLKRNTMEQHEKVAKLREHQKQLLAQKAQMESKLRDDADKQVARREELEQLIMKVCCCCCCCCCCCLVSVLSSAQVKLLFDEENEKRGQLENVKANLEIQLKRTQRVCKFP
jgi:hypothetical protein